MCLKTLKKKTIAQLISNFLKLTILEYCFEKNTLVFKCPAEFEGDIWGKQNL